jgi:hypothetical protein
VPIVEESDEAGYCSVKCRDPDGYVIEAAWEVPPSGADATLRPLHTQIALLAL